MKRYVNAALTKRFGAFMLDLFTIVFTATIVYSLLGKALVNTRAFKEANTIMNEILVESNLYEYDENDKNVTKVVDEKEYEVVIEKYYVEIKKDADTYHDKMQESNLFDYVNDEYVKKENVTDEEVKEFYKEMMGEAIIEVKKDENFMYCYRLTMNFVIYNLIASVLITYLFYICLVPIMMKRRSTVGQHIMNLSLVNVDTNEPASKAQVFFRSIIILLIEGFLSIVGVGLPIIVSVGFILFNKNKMSYHDILSTTKLIDYHYVELDDKRKEGKN